MFEIMLITEDKKALHAYKANVIPMVGDYLTVVGHLDRFFLVEKRILDASDGNKILLTGKLTVEIV